MSCEGRFDSPWKNSSCLAFWSTSLCGILPANSRITLNTQQLILWHFFAKQQLLLLFHRLFSAISFSFCFWNFIVVFPKLWRSCTFLCLRAYRILRWAFLTRPLHPGLPRLSFFIDQDPKQSVSWNTYCSLLWLFKLFESNSSCPRALPTFSDQLVSFSPLQISFVFEFLKHLRSPSRRRENRFLPPRSQTDSDSIYLRLHPCLDHCPRSF